MKKIEQNKALKQTAILDAAWTVFLSEGYAQARMDSIADKACVTKQTVYRYFPSKIVLFQAVLEEKGKRAGGDFRAYLEKVDIREALLAFARAFIRFHLSDEHIATFRLLVAESTKFPEITQSFMSVGADETADTLSGFFAQRLSIEDSAAIVRVWTGMLLELRSSVLIGMPSPTAAEIDDHAAVATDFLLAYIA